MPLATVKEAVDKIGEIRTNVENLVEQLPEELAASPEFVEVAKVLMESVDVVWKMASDKLPAEAPAETPAETAAALTQQGSGTV